MRQIILLVDDDSTITKALALALECPGRTLVVCSDVHAAELALESFDFTDVVTDVQFSGLFGFEGLHFIDRIRARVPGARTVLMTGYASEALRSAASDYGVAAVLSKPFEVAELEAVLGTVDEETPFELLAIPTITELIQASQVESVFQPIVSNGTTAEEPFAFEALARVKGGWPLGGVVTLFEYAARCDRSAELNRATIVAAIEAAADLPARSLLFVNVDPPTFSDARLVRDVVATAARAGIAPDRIVLEITERSSLGGDSICSETFEALRRAGVRFALDDHGSAYSHLSTISMIRPSFIKISAGFGTGFESDRDKHLVIRNVLSLAKDFGCFTVLEGIETEATATAAKQLGIDLAQGYYFSVPRHASHWRRVAA